MVKDCGGGEDGKTLTGEEEGSMGSSEGEGMANLFMDSDSDSEG